jgi:parvulin-like peptidyl-prolyl isomerase
MLLVAAVATACGGGGAGTTPAANDVATVGPLHITKQRFEDQLNVARVNLKAQGQKFPKAGTTEYETLKANAMALLVMSAARELKAQEQGIEVTEQQVTKRLQEIKKQYFGGNEKKYRAQVAKQGLSDAEVRAQIRTQLVSERIAEQITGEVSVSDDDVTEYYEENIGQYVQKTRDVLEILVGKDKKLAFKLHKQLKNGADFAKLAKRYSQDPGSKDIGGKFTARQGQDVANFDKVAFSIKTGELAPPVNTPEYGWFLIKAVSPVREEKQAKEEVAPTIRAQLAQEKRNDAMTEWLTDATESVCDGRISYQVGYTPNPDPCVQLASLTSSSTTS